MRELRIASSSFWQWGIIAFDSAGVFDYITQTDRFFKTGQFESR
jgi:hypothetical protein